MPCRYMQVHGIGGLNMCIRTRTIVGAYMRGRGMMRVRARVGDWIKGKDQIVPDRVCRRR